VIIGRSTDTSRGRPLNDVRPITEAGVWANVARQPTKGLALDFLTSASDLRLGAAKALQQGLQSAEMNQRNGPIGQSLAVRKAEISRRVHGADCQGRLAAHPLLSY
jgi:hypothetical protein